MSIVSSNNESEVQAKKELGWVRVFYYAFCKISRFQPCFFSFQDKFFIALPVWDIRGC